MHAANRRRPARPYLAVVLGAFSRKVIGLALEAHLQAELAYRLFFKKKSESLFRKISRIRCSIPCEHPWFYCKHLMFNTSSPSIQFRQREGVRIECLDLILLTYCGLFGSAAAARNSIPTIARLFPPLAHSPPLTLLLEAVGSTIGRAPVP